jgi:hypothetical protein
VLCRDLVDLAALRLRVGPIPRAAWLKAEGAYKEAARRDLVKASARFAGAEPLRARCFEGLAIAGGLRGPMVECITNWAGGLE